MVTFPTCGFIDPVRPQIARIQDSVACIAFYHVYENCTVYPCENVSPPASAARDTTCTRPVPPRSRSSSCSIVCWDEQQRRLYTSLESTKRGHGGDSLLAGFLGLDPHTIAPGCRHLLDQDVRGRPDVSNSRSVFVRLQSCCPLRPSFPSSSRPTSRTMTVAAAVRSLHAPLPKGHIESRHRLGQLGK
jgi:hypothetical protein